MNDREIEEEIQCTTGQEETPIADLRDSVESVSCSCGQSFPHNENGASALLRKCRTCFLMLREDLGDSACGNEINNDHEADIDLPSNDVPTDEANVASLGDNTANTNEAAPGDLNANVANDIPTIDFVLGAMTLAVGDSNKAFSIILNGNKEEFKYFSDPVNGSAARKLFTRKSWSHPALYWYRAYGAMATGKRVMISPSVIELKGGQRLVLCAIFETMCNRPRYDGLVYSFDQNIAYIVKDLLAKFQSTDMAMPFDSDLVDRQLKMCLIFLQTH